ncbi:hypothetical protein [Enterovibrio norvegicus]|uniref:hypothetical protein n=1 Tax=Enterovibrio norvegicus TaxID=188144 RepID=UPI000C82507C|nr:hypothetical protein [Enterovibrio norvegicus]PMN73184.1 hypothetical protein BCT27_12645 [Enterovibrio norvegicus]
MRHTLRQGEHFCIGPALQLPGPTLPSQDWTREHGIITTGSGASMTIVDFATPRECMIEGMVFTTDGSNVALDVYFGDSSKESTLTFDAGELAGTWQKFRFSFNFKSLRLRARNNSSPTKFKEITIKEIL